MTAKKPQMPIIRFHPPTPIEDPLDRTLPYVLRGREEEFTHIAGALIDSHVTMYTIEGPPGTGKTSLIRGLGAYAARRGYTVVSVQASEINTSEKLGGRIWSTLTEEHSAPQSVKKERGRSTGGGLGRVIRHERNRGTETLYEATATLSDNIQQCLQANQKRTAGLLILIDNAAQWRTYLDEQGRPKIEAAPLREICDSLNEGVHELDLPVPVRTIIAGTPGTIATVRALPSRRLPTESHYRLQGVTHTAVEQIILDHLRLLDAKSQLILPRAPMSSTLLSEIAAACDGNVWHASKTGYQLQQLYCSNPRPSDADIRTAAAQARTSVHEEIGERIEPHLETAVAGIAVATIHNQNRLPRKATEHLVAQLSTSENESQVIEDCVQLGLIELMRNVGRYPRRTKATSDQDHYRIPIPCLANWITQNYQQELADHQNIMDEHLSRMRTVPAWTWNQHPDVRPISALPRRTSRRYTSGQAATLLPAVPDDEKTPQALLRIRPGGKT